MTEKVFDCVRQDLESGFCVGPGVLSLMQRLINDQTETRIQSSVGRRVVVVVQRLTIRAPLLARRMRCGVHEGACIGLPI